MSVISLDPLKFSHHLTLSDGYDTVALILASKGVAQPQDITGAAIDRTALKTTSGSQTFYDFEKPWTPVSQDSFAGGIGNRNLEEAVNRYLGSRSLNTVHGKMVLSGERMYGTGIQANYIDMPGGVVWHKLNVSNYKGLAKRIVFSSTFTGVSVDTIIRRVGKPTDLVISFHPDSSGKPGTALSSITVNTTLVPDLISYVYQLVINNSIAINDVRWIQWYCADVDNENYWMVGCNATRDRALISLDVTTWYNAPVEPYCLIKPASKAWQPIFFDYKYAKYICISEEGQNPLIFMEGWRGKAIANADVDGLTDSTQSFPVNGLIGLVCTVYAGKGSTQSINYRTIASNTNTKVTFTSNSASAFDATTEYVISGGGKWNPVTGWGLTGVCSSVLEYNGIVYFALGKAINIRRVRWTASVGYEFADDGTNKATFITTVREPASTKIWIANNDPPTIQKAPVAGWANMIFATALQFDDAKHGRITFIGEYGETTKVLWVMREGFIFTVTEAGVVERFFIDEIQLLRTLTNGTAFWPSNIYLYFNWGPSIYRWYNKELKDVGPVVEEGMPLETAGYCSAIRSSPGCIYAAYTPYLSTGYATIYVHNGIGWAEYYRSASPGTAIKDFCYQITPGGINRMWIFDGNDIIALPVPNQTLIVYKDPNYTYHYEGVFESSYYAANMYNIYKIYNSLIVFASNLSPSTWIEADYQLDEQTEWIPLKEFFTVGPSQEVSMRSSDTKLADIFKGVTGKQFRYRFRIYTSDPHTTAIIRTIVIEAVSRIPIKYSFTASIKIEDNQRDLLGNDTGIRAVDVIGKLRYWADNFIPLRLSSIYPEMDNKIVFLEPPPMTPTTATGSNQYALTIVATEL